MGRRAKSRVCSTSSRRCPIPNGSRLAGAPSQTRDACGRPRLHVRREPEDRQRHACFARGRRCEGAARSARESTTCAPMPPSAQRRRARPCADRAAEKLSVAPGSRRARNLSSATRAPRRAELTRPQTTIGDGSAPALRDEQRLCRRPPHTRSGRGPLVSAVPSGRSLRASGRRGSCAGPAPSISAAVRGALAFRPGRRRPSSADRAETDRCRRDHDRRAAGSRAWGSQWSRSGSGPRAEGSSSARAAARPGRPPAQGAAACPG